MSSNVCPFYCDHACLVRMYNSGLAGSAFCVFLSMVICFVLIIKHLHHFNLPYFQSKIIIMLMMAPFYGLTSIISLALPTYAAYFELVRDVYLAFLLFTFFYLMFSYMAYDPVTQIATDLRVYTTMIEHEESIHHLWPFNYCTSKYMLSTPAKAKYFTYRCKKFILQYFVLKPFLTVILLVAHPFIASHIIETVSTVLEDFIILSETLSLYYLVLFYVALKHPLAPYRPLLKFLIVKITLFFTFWQNLTLSIFHDQIISCFEPDEVQFTKEGIISSIENTLVCIEMFLMSLACISAFTWHDFVQLQNATGSIYEVFKDTWGAFLHDFRLIKPKKFGFDPKVRQQEEPLLKQLENGEVQVEMTEFNRLSKAVKIAYI